ncbi:MAG TPA: bifunctional 3,4-dihydroxy-2-butanone-4-phosphate synthase/GTP cyclohydrolase II [Methanomicrobia archaeon]|nr:bifunctional 3,4-dihydroxy-2-butanone-4-phosphate synthase/GTP cyclohydrolase II [Methanomicrobia archaeon]
MTLATIEEAIEDIREGKMIIVVDDEDRENEGDLVMAAALATPENVTFMVTHGRGLLCVPLEASRTRALDLPQMVKDNTDPHATAFCVSVDEASTDTGISGHERCTTIRALASSTTAPACLRRPGHVFPLRAREGGVLSRPGHTEASVDLARLAGLPPAGAICEILNDDGTMARLPELEVFAKRHGLKIITIEDLIRYMRRAEEHVRCEAVFHAPTRHGAFEGRSYRDQSTGECHVVLIKGDLANADRVLVRVHSECLTGDALGSLRCDCGAQLEAALNAIGKSEAGVLVYLRQEGRGIGLHNKLQAYELQDGGEDTYQANESLGFPPDARSYHGAGHILSDLGVKRILLLTNNPQKIGDLDAYGIDVVHAPLQVPVHEEGLRYMRTKHERFGHMLGPIEIMEGATDEDY